MNTVNLYDFFEWTLKADASHADNPFQQISLKAVLTGPNGEKRLDGFYDGGDRFIIRYMPKTEGEYRLTTRSNLPALNGLTTSFTALPAATGNHGPVEVDGTHFRHHDRRAGLHHGAPPPTCGTTGPKKSAKRRSPASQCTASTRSGCCSSPSTTPAATAPST